MKKFFLSLVLLSLLSGTADASHPPAPPEADCTDGVFSVFVIFHDGRHGGGVFFEGRVNFDDGGFVERIAAIDGLVRIDRGPNIKWRGDGFHLRVNTSRRPGDTSLVPAKFNGRDDDGNPIMTGNLVCWLFVR